MLFARGVLALSFALAACGDSFPGPSPAGCVQDVTPGRHTVECVGLSYDVSVPAACTTRACGLIFDVHGATMNAAMEENNTKLAALGEVHGYVVVQPSAMDGSWEPDRDDRKVFSFLEQVRDAFQVDRARIHFTGFSQGGFMSWRFICAHSDVLASAAPAGAGDAIAGITSCDLTTARSLPILYMHGTDDALVPFDGAIRQRDAVISAFALDRTESLEMGGAHRRTRHSNANGGLFEFIEHDYITEASYGVAPVIVHLRGHCFPGSTDLEGTVPGQLMPFACTMPAPSEFVWGETVMQFFLDHPRR